MVVCTPALEALAEASGEPCDVIVPGAWCRDVFAHLPFVRNLYEYQENRIPYLVNAAHKALVARLRERGAGPCWIFGKDRGFPSLLKRSGFAPEHIVVESPPLPPMHAGERWATLAMQRPRGAEDWKASVVPTDLNWTLRLSPQEKDAAPAVLQRWGVEPHRFVIIQTGNKKTMRRGKVDRSFNIKYWPAESWAQVADRIAEESGMYVLLPGAPQEREMIEGILGLCKSDRVLAAYDNVGIRCLTQLLDQAHSCISVDTGPAHMSAGINCPLVVLFGATDPSRDRACSSGSAVTVVLGTDPEAPDEPDAAWRTWHDLRFLTPQAVLTAWQQLPPRS